MFGHAIGREGAIRAREKAHCAGCGARCTPPRAATLRRRRRRRGDGPAHGEWRDAAAGLWLQSWPVGLEKGVAGVTVGGGRGKGGDG